MDLLAIAEEALERIARPRTVALMHTQDKAPVLQGIAKGALKRIKCARQPELSSDTNSEQNQGKSTNEHETNGR